jgi:type IX secretion system substrate protein
MKKILTIIAAMAGLGMNAQTLGNPGFENWIINTTYATDTVPANWWAYYCNTVHQTTDSYQGTYATKIQGWFACGIAPGMLINGQAPVDYGNYIESGTPFTSKPASISGFYKYTDVTADDSAEVTIILKRYNSLLMKRDTVAFATKTLGAAASYSSFTVSLPDLMPGIMPDSIIIMFNSSKYYRFDMTTMALPSLYVDRIALPETASDILEMNGQTIDSKVYPNPLTGASMLSIDTDLSKFENVSVEIYDTQGKKVIEIRDLKENKIPVAGRFSKGNYLYSVKSSNNVISTGKFTVQ